MSEAHAVWQSTESLQTKFPGQFWGDPVTQAPRPSHVETVVSLSVQVRPQVVTALGKAHVVPMPSQVPPQLASPLAQRVRPP